MSNENSTLLKAVLDGYAVPDPKIVGTISRSGVPLSYVSHSEITRILIEVDPLWSWEPIEWVEGRPAIHVENGMATMWGKLTLLGKSMICVGSARADKADYEKELIGDLLRNGSMRFGIALSLWSKEWDSQPQTTVATQRVMDAFPTATKVTTPTSASKPVAKPAQAQPVRQASSGNPISDKQVFLINKLAKENSVSDVVGFAVSITGRAVDALNKLNSKEASQVIDRLMNPQPVVEIPVEPVGMFPDDEEPF